MLALPGSVLLTRGNPERLGLYERPARSGGGFASAVKRKYDGATYGEFAALFGMLPIAAVIGGQALVVHGGLSRQRSATLRQLRRIDARRGPADAPETYDEWLLFDSLRADSTAQHAMAQRSIHGTYAVPGGRTRARRTACTMPRAEARLHT
jgi:hypothetical protein